MEENRATEEVEFEAAQKALSCLITQRKRADGANWGDAFSLMNDYIEILDLRQAVRDLKIIHIAGTKGKGSTCAFAESVLRANGVATGMFTSPHLVDVRERFRFNGKLVQKDIFLKHFWWCYNRLKENCTETIPMPAYFRFLTLLALRLFTAEKVEVALLEVGLGGRYDATNIVERPVVCGVSSLGFDHMELLGYTLREIAGEKAGIFKPGVTAVTSPQPEEAMAALQKRADELKIRLEEAPSLHHELTGVALGLAGVHQRMNAALALALCRKWAEATNHSALLEAFRNADCSQKLPDSLIRGLESARWPGRAQILRVPLEDRNGLSSGAPCLSYFLDGAHTPESMEVCGGWFAEASEKAPGGAEGGCVRNILLFNCMPERDPQALLTPLIHALQTKGVFLHNAIVVPSFSSYTSVGPHQSPAISEKLLPDLSWQRNIQSVWEAAKSGGQKSGKDIFTSHVVSGWKHFGSETPPNHGEGFFVGPTSFVMPSLPTALDFFKSFVKQNPPIRLQVLVTGSLHLVGDVLRLMKYRL